MSSWLLWSVTIVTFFTFRTTAIVSNLCESTDEKVFFSCLWDGVLHSSQVRLSALTFVMGWMAKKPVDGKQEVIGSDVNLMVCLFFLSTQWLFSKLMNFKITWKLINFVNLSKRKIIAKSDKKELKHKLLFSKIIFKFLLI